MGNGQGARVSAVSALVYSTHILSLTVFYLLKPQNKSAVKFVS